MEELKKINRILEKEYPDAYRETLVVLDATTGQNALASSNLSNVNICILLHLFIVLPDL